MNRAELLKSIEAGAILICVEFRHSIAEKIDWIDKATGRKMSMIQLKHTVEAADRTIVLQDRVDEDFKLSDFKSPFVKGERLIFSVRTLTLEKGFTRATGTLQKLETTPNGATVKTS